MEPVEKFLYWYNSAKYDLVTADAMYEAKRWIYVVFMCQQAVEKLAKGLYGLYLDFESIPRTHNIRRLINDFTDKLPQDVPDETYALFDQLTYFYLNNRYPDYVEDLVHQLNENNTNDILKQSKEVFAWLQTMKP